MPANAKQQVLDLINDANNTAFTFDHLEFGVPQPNPEHASLNTAMVVSSKNTTTFSGSVTVNYRRLDLAILFAMANKSFLFDPTWTTTRDLIPAINARFNLQLEPEDLINDPLVNLNNLPAAQTLRAHSDSYGYIGQCAFTLTQAATFEIEYNQTLPSSLHALLDSNSISHDGFATMTAANLLFAVRPLTYDADYNPLPTISDVNHNVDISLTENVGWDIVLAMQGLAAKDLITDNRVRLRIGRGLDEVVRPLKVYEHGGVGYDYPRLDVDGNTEIAESYVNYDSDEHSALLYLSDYSPELEVDFPDADFDSNTSDALGVWRYTLEILDEDGAVEYSMPIQASITPASSGGAVGDGGFVVAASSRTFLADRLNQALIITDIGAPTGFPLLVSGQNGEVFAFKNEYVANTGTNNNNLIMRYSYDKGQTWEEQIFEDWAIGERAVFWKGQVYSYIEGMPGWATPRVCRLTNVEGWWTWEYLADIDYAVSGMACSENRLTIADEDRKLHHTDDGINWTIESFESFMFEGELSYTRSVVIQYIGDTLVGLCMLDSGQTHFAEQVAFIRNGPDDFTFKRVQPYGATTPGYTWNFAYLGSGLRDTTITIGNRWFITTHTTNHPSGSKRTRGDVWYSDDMADTWTQVVFDCGISGPDFVYDGNRLLMSGVKWSASAGNAGWAGISEDLGMTWTFDSDTTSPFGEHRNEVVYAAARTNGSVEYPTRPTIPELEYQELQPDPTDIYSGSEVQCAISLSNNGFAVGGDFYASQGAPRNGLFVFNSYGMLTEFDAQLTEGPFLNTGFVNAIADAGDNLAIVGNFIEVGGTTRNGIAWVNRSTGELDLNYENPSFLDEDGNAALLQGIAMRGDGKFYVAGKFTSVNGHATNCVALLNSDGSVDTSFTSALPNLRGTYYVFVDAMHVLDDERLLISISGVQNGWNEDHPRVMNTDGSLDPSFWVSEGFVNTIVPEPNGGVTLFGGGLRWDAETTQHSAMQLFAKPGGGWARDTTFSFPNTRLGQINGAAKLSTGVYCLISRDIYPENGWQYNSMGFVDGLGQEIDYTNIHFDSSGGASGSGSRIVCNALDRILVTGQFYAVNQDVYPRRRGERRNGALHYWPWGAREGVTGGSTGPDENSPGGSPPPAPAITAGDLGFFVSQANQAALTENLNGYEGVTDVEVPLLEPAYGSVVQGGEQGEMFALEGYNNRVELSYSSDGGRNFQAPQSFAGYRVGSEEAVFYKGHLYAVLSSDDWQMPSIVARFVGVDNEGVMDFTLETVLEFDTDGVGQIALAANDTYLVASESQTGRVHVSENGVDWTPHLFQHPYGDPQNVGALPIFEIESITLAGDVLVAAGWTENRTDGGNEKLLIMQCNLTDMSTSYAAAIDYATLGLTEWSYDGIRLCTVNNNGSPRIIATFRDVYDDINYPGQSTVGDLWISDTLGASFARQIANTGIQAGRVVDDGSTLLFFGRHDSWTNGQHWLAKSTNRGTTWVFDDNPSTIFGEARFDAIYAAARRFNGAAYPAMTALPAANSRLQADPKIASSTASARTLEWANAGQYYVAGNFSQVGEDHTSWCVARFNADGTPDTNFALAETDSWVEQILVRPDNSLITLGTHYTIGGIGRRGLTWVDAQGTVNTSIAALSFKDQYNGDAYPKAMRWADDLRTKFFVYGYTSSYVFTQVAGVNRGGLARINVDGTVDLGFTVGIDSYGAVPQVEALLRLSDDYILVSGPFTQGGIVLLNEDGSMNSAFPTQSTSARFTAGYFDDVDGALYLFGYSMSVNGGITTYNAMKFTVTGLETGTPTFTHDTTFHSDGGYYVNDVVRLASDDLLLVGSFGTQFDNVPANFTARINPYSGEMLSVQVGARFNGQIYRALHLGGDRVVVTGDFGIVAAGSYPRLGTRKNKGGLVSFDVLPRTQTYATWDAGDMGTNAVLTNDDLTLSRQAGTGVYSGSALSTTQYSSGKRYVEFIVDGLSASDNLGVGVVDAGTAYTHGTYLGSGSNSWSLWADGPSGLRAYHVGGSTAVAAMQLTSEDVVGMAIDMDTGKIWWSVNGVWLNSSDPAAGVNPVYSNLSGPFKLAAEVALEPRSVTLVADPSNLMYAAPAGFTPGW